jgi:O-antigen/teichoic acid export membrane protein
VRNLGSKLGWVFAEKGVRLLAGLFQLFLVARYLGTERYGDLGTAIALATLIMGPASLGFDPTLVRRFVVRSRDSGTLLGTALAYRVAASVVLVALTISVAPFAFSDRLGSLTSIAVLVVLANAPFAIESWYRANNEQHVPACAHIAGAGIGVSLRVGGVYCDLDVHWFAAVPTIELLVACIVCWTIYLRKGGSVSKPNSKQGLGLLAESWPSLAATFTGAVFMRTDVLVLRALTDDHQTGVYLASLRLIESLMILPVSVATVATPVLIALRSKSYIDYHKFFAAITAGIVITCTLIATALWMSAPQIVHLIYGQNFADSADTLRILAFSYIPMSAGVCWGIYWVAEMRQAMILALTSIGSLVVFLVSASIASECGARGAAIAQLIGHTIPFIVVFLLPTFRSRIIDVALACLRPVATARTIRRAIS